MPLQQLFPVGHPAGKDDVVDREEFIGQVVDRLLTRNSVVLAAPRRLGKTSVAHEVLRRVRDEHDAYTVDLDLSEVSSLREMADRLAAACLDNAPALRALGVAKEGLARLLRMPEVRTKFAEYEVSLGLNAPAAKQPVDLLLDAALRLPEQMAKRDGRPFIVLLDEFQAATGVGGPELLSRMRAVMQQQEHTSYLFLGSQASLMAQLFGAGNQPFFRFATWLDLPPVPKGAWQSFIRGRLAGRGIHIEDAALEAMLDYTGAHPSDTMEVAQEAYLLGKRRRVIDGHLAVAVCASVQERLSLMFDMQVELFGLRARPLLGRIANGLPVFEGERSRDAVQRTLTSLVRAGVLAHVGHGRYDITEPMLWRHFKNRG